MKRILLQSIFLHDHKTNILIEGNRFADLNALADVPADEVVCCEGLAIMPAFYNTHTHSAMALLRGYADDMPLKTWLEDYIWPREAQLSAADIKEGSRLAIREMIKSGTVFFSDMYFDMDGTIEVAEEMGVRAAVGITFMENHPKATHVHKTRRVHEWSDRGEGRITITCAPHAIYTVSGTGLQYASRLAREKGIRLHMHLSETIGEVEACVREHGMRPVHYLDSLGILGPEVILAHCVHLDDSEIEVLARRGVTIAHCPCSNMKLGSGILPYRKLIEAGVRVTLGTDGCSSNNNLDLHEEMKFAALLSKVGGDVECLPAPMAMEWATRNGAEAFGIDAGVIEEGKLADCLLVDLTQERMQPCYHLVSNWVYAADTSCINSVMCDGKWLMRDGKLLV